MFINDIHSLGLNATNGMYLTDSWYWNQTPEARTWARRYFEKMKKMPSSLQAADYSATMQYLNAVKAAGTDDPEKVMAKLRSMKFNDFYIKDGYLRADGSVIKDMFLMQVKASPNRKSLGITTKWYRPYRVNRLSPPRLNPSAHCGNKAVLS